MNFRVAEDERNGKSMRVRVFGAEIFFFFEKKMQSMPARGGDASVPGGWETKIWTRVVFFGGGWVGCEGREGAARRRNEEDRGKSTPMAVTAALPCHKGAWCGKENSLHLSSTVLFGRKVEKMAEKAIADE